MSKSDRLLDSSVCPGCGAGLRCGVVTGDTKCWCFDFARVIDVPDLDKKPPSTCLCPACLEKLIANQRP